MKSSVAGKSTSMPEITNITNNGIWLIAKNREYFLPYSEFPWFKDAKVGAILDIRLLHARHLFWPKLDIDLDLDSLSNIENYPLVYR